MFDSFEEIAYIKIYANIYTDPKFKKSFFQQTFFMHRLKENFRKTKSSIAKTVSFLNFLWKI